MIRKVPGRRKSDRALFSCHRKLRPFPMAQTLQGMRTPHKGKSLVLLPARQKRERTDDVVFMIRVLKKTMWEAVDVR